eukprot:5872319-Pleurochrysis_carterae.AAC.4
MGSLASMPPPYSGRCRGRCYRQAPRRSNVKCLLCTHLRDECARTERVRGSQSRLKLETASATTAIDSATPPPACFTSPTFDFCPPPPCFTFCHLSAAPARASAPPPPSPQPRHTPRQISSSTAEVLSPSPL